jgi:hypothetical protein
VCCRTPFVIINLSQRLTVLRINLFSEVSHGDLLSLCVIFCLNQLFIRYRQTSFEFHPVRGPMGRPGTGYGPILVGVAHEIPPFWLIVSEHSYVFTWIGYPSFSCTGYGIHISSLSIKCQMLSTILYFRCQILCG